MSGKPIWETRQTLLEVKGLQIRYGEVQAVTDLDLVAEEGGITVLLGPNGAGKTSTLMAISGVVCPAAGSIIFDGADVAHLGPHERYRRGIVQVPEGRMIFNSMTVRENLMIATDGVRGIDRQALSFDWILQFFPVLRERLDQRASTLSGGQAQMLALARGLAASPRLFMLDEPSLGLAPKVVREIFELIVDLNKQGLTVLLVEQNVRQALQISRQAYLLEAGRLVASGPSATMRESEDVVRAYLGA